MTAYLQVWGESGPSVVPLLGDRAVIGRDGANDIALGSDKTVSRVHAVLQRYASGWTLRDLGSANGTLLNGQAATAERALRPGDEITVGATRLIFRTDADAGTFGGRTVVITERAPEITRRERDVLVELCRPLGGPGQFTQPASIQAIADALVVSRAAVTFHLDNLYAKFNITAGGGAGRRVQLANAALSSGAISRADLRGPDSAVGA